MVAMGGACRQRHAVVQLAWANSSNCSPPAMKSLTERRRALRIRLRAHAEQSVVFGGPERLLVSARCTDPARTQETYGSCARFVPAPFGLASSQAVARNAGGVGSSSYSASTTSSTLQFGGEWTDVPHMRTGSTRTVPSVAGPGGGPVAGMLRPERRIQPGSFVLHPLGSVGESRWARCARRCGRSRLGR